MTTRATIGSYFERLSQGGDWKGLIADDVSFTILTSPRKTVEGKEAYLQSTRNFYASLARVALRDLLVDGERACALTRYNLAPPTGAAGFESDVAEIFTVRDGRIASLTICFDTAPYPK